MSSLIKSLTFLRKYKLVNKTSELLLLENSYLAIASQIIGIRISSKMSGLKLIMILKELRNHDKLKLLILENNKLSSRIATLINPNLIELHIINAEIEYIPNIKGVKTLRITSCDFSKAEIDLGFYSNLEVLRLANNNLVDLPKLDGELKYLKEFFAENNRLSELPVNWCLNLPNVEYVNLENNKLRCLPHNIGNLKNLRIFKLTNNKIGKLPVSIDDLFFLEKLDIRANPITQDTHELADILPLKAKIKYLLEISHPETVHLNEAKVLVLGEERVGKTSLINRIFDRSLDENQASTMGVNIESYKFKNGIKVNIWDFAGQEITHQTHQFFLSARSLYILVIDAQKEDDSAKTRYWLNTIKITAGKDVPVIIVVNKMDLNEGFVFDINRYKSEFNNIVELLYFSASNDEIKSSSCVREIKKAISHHIQSIKEVFLKFPPAWLSVKNTLERHQEVGVDFIESTQFEDYCVENKIIEPAMQNALLTILNQIGTVVTYKDHKSLDIMQIINPDWVTNGVYKILRAKQINDSEAIFRRKQFQAIFSGDIRYSKPRHFNWLLNLLKQFQLAFDIGEEAVLLPSRLSATQPYFNNIEYQKGLNFRFEYKDLLKKNVISRFIVVLHPYIADKEIKYWQRGVFLQYGKTDMAHAVVISDEDTKTITISINKTNRNARELMTIIRHTIRSINGNQSVAEEQVPLVLDNAVAGYCDYEEAVDAEQEKISHIRKKVEGKFISFEVSELLDGYRIRDSTEFDHENFIRDFILVCSLETENRISIEKENENSTTDRIRNGLLNRNHNVADQSRGGNSKSGKSSGYRDLVIRNPNTGVAECVIEAIEIRAFNRTQIIEHYKRLIHYDTVGNKLNILVSYVKTIGFEEIVAKYSLVFNEFHFAHSTHKNVARGYTNIKGQKILHVLINFHPALMEKYFSAQVLDKIVSKLRQDTRNKA